MRHRYIHISVSVNFNTLQVENKNTSEITIMTSSKMISMIIYPERDNKIEKIYPISAPLTSLKIYFAFSKTKT